MIEFTKDERQEASAMVHVAMLERTGNNYYASKDEIISAHNQNAIDLQCRLTRALELLREVVYMANECMPRRRIKAVDALLEEKKS